MKVICIDAGGRKSPFTGIIRVAKDLIEGEVYTVIEHGVSPSGFPFTILEENKSNLYKGSYHSDRFIPLSEIDETELIEQIQITV